MLSGLSGEKRAVGVFAQRSDVELAVRELKNANFPMGKVSVIARFLVFVGGTDIQLAGARDILERNGMQDFGIYSPSVISLTNSHS